MTTTWKAPTYNEAVFAVVDVVPNETAVDNKKIHRRMLINVEILVAGNYSLESTTEETRTLVGLRIGTNDEWGSYLGDLEIPTDPTGAPHDDGDEITFVWEARTGTGEKHQSFHDFVTNGPIAPFDPMRPLEFPDADYLLDDAIVTTARVPS